ncbi:MAG TPA: glycosyltransferase [Phycisphaerae bacterium]|nr:glycosyltransferase [Phycisphaerae bacterium]
MKVLHIGSYWMGENDIVQRMAAVLSEMVPTVCIDTLLYQNGWHRWVEREGEVYWLREDALLPVVEQERPDVIVCNAGGHGIRPETRARLGKAVLVGIALSDPDVFDYQTRYIAPHFDLFYTNCPDRIGDYASIGVEARLLPFAVDPAYYRPLGLERDLDVVLVGHARPDRKVFVAPLQRHFRVGLFGRGWGGGCGEATGREHVRAINRGKLYLSLTRTLAQFHNTKGGVFEASACRTPVVTEHLAQTARYFEFGREIIGFDGADDLPQVIAAYLNDGSRREAVAEAAYRRVLREHTWQKRWEQVLDDVRSQSRLGPAVAGRV